MIRIHADDVFDDLMRAAATEDADAFVSSFEALPMHTTESLETFSGTSHFLTVERS